MLFPSLSLLALAASLVTPFTYAHTAHDHAAAEYSLERRATSCPSGSGSIVSSFWPAWLSSTQGPGTTSGSFPWSKNTHAFYFVVVTTSTGVSLPGGQTTADITTFVKSAHKKGRKALFTVGGWSGSVYFSDHMISSAKRLAFAKSLETFRSTYGFDGIDIDWEFIGRQGAGTNKVRAKDAANFLLFLPQLRSTVGTSILIAASMPASGITGADGASLASTAKYGAHIDLLTIMAYDMYANSWSATTGPNAPLYTCNANSGSVQASVEQWIASGFPACRILLGVPGYSHVFRTKSTKLATTTFRGVKTTAFQTLLATQPSDPTTTYNGLISNGWLSSDGTKGAGGYTRYWDACTRTPFLFSPATKRWISYDDASSIGAKALYARSKGLAGVNFYDSTGPSGAVYDAATKGLKGTFSTTAARRKRSLQDEPWRLDEEDDDEEIYVDDFDFTPELASEEVEETYSSWEEDV
ncbi:glycoside hydrolase superfamily [Leucosporidium creatinivorum]|uniref:Glycoside hydrolase superfamily n=1 Tax=Leucosporidium creatinivorum TaxID=106004 RepID=A0A1Y2G285_9BASI|nr:glycoside hydrolase superfamily [Leucosporidium creatinivorum]